MKKLISLITASVLTLCFCACGSSVTQVTTDDAASVIWAHINDCKDAAMTFSFDIESNYTHVIVTVNSGTLVADGTETQTEDATEIVTEAQTEESDASVQRELRLEVNESFLWIPDEKAEVEPVIVVQICNKNQTIHCGTITLLPKKTTAEIDGKDVGAVEYRAVADSDDGMKIRQGSGETNVVIYS